MRVELFRADCRLCERTENTLRYILKDYDVELIVHRASECKDGSCCRLAEIYGIKAVPSIVVDGELVHVGILDEEGISKLKGILS